MKPQNPAKPELLSDKNLMATIGHFIQHHRLRQNRSQDQVANDAGISRSTLSLLERGETVKTDSLIRVLRVLNLLYIMQAFQIEEQISPLEYAKQKKRKQASPRKKTGKDKKDLGW